MKEGRSPLRVGGTELPLTAPHAPHSQGFRNKCQDGSLGIRQTCATHPGQSLPSSGTLEKDHSLSVPVLGKVLSMARNANQFHVPLAERGEFISETSTI